MRSDSGRAKGDGLDYMYAGVVRSVNVELLQRQLQERKLVWCFGIRIWKY